MQTEEFLTDAKQLHRQMVQSLFQLFETQCEGSIAVDRDARIVWINDKYRLLLGLPEHLDVVGRDVEEIIPQSQMRQVISSGRPMLLDIMAFQNRDFVVTRIPLIGADGEVTGAVGFVLYDTIEPLSHILSKFNHLQNRLAKTERELAIHRKAKYSFSQFLGNNPAIQEIRRNARRAAQLDSNVLLLGETGTGKEMLAHAIHMASRRADQPFVAVNVTAIPETLLEAEFFGVAPGAFTGADRKGRKGKFEVANGGTLFLDEIGDMPLNLQAKLLRVLQEREFEPLGSNRIVRSDVRIIAATSADLEEKVAKGEFRTDLFYRLKVFPIRLVPLRDRLDDIPLLCERLLEQIVLRNRGEARDLDDSALALLGAYHWPGNVRELGNILEQACAFSDKSKLGASEFNDILPVQPRAHVQQGAQRGIRPLAEMVTELERTAIRSALEATRGKKTAAAKLLGISRAKLYERLSEFGMLSKNWTGNV